MLLRLADPKRMRAAGQKPGVEEGSNDRSRYRAVANAPLRRLDLDQGLEEEHSARAGTDDLDRKSARARFGRDPRPHLVGANRERGGILRNENTRHAARASSRASVILSRSKRPSGSPSRR